jgi:septum site-determining protein MinC
MPRADKKTQLIEFKGTSLPVVAVTVRSLQPEELAEAASALFGEEAFFDGDAALLELSQLEDVTQADWGAVRAILDAHGLAVIGVRGGNAALRRSAAAAGLPSFAAIERASRAAAEATAPATPTPTPAAPAPAKVATPATQASRQEAPLAVANPTQVIDRPLRSGQQVYARGGDLVVLAAVNSGAEVIADGSIHIYAPLRGRALAGASGAKEARIFTTRFEAELVSIAGVYRTFETGVPDQLAGQPVQVQLCEAPGETSSKLTIEALKTN